MRRLTFSMILVFLTVFLTGCVKKPLQTEKIRELTFVVLSEDEIPKELKEQIEKEKEHTFRMSYEDAGVLYIAEGYGTQSQTGYQVEVKEVYETENAIVFHTHLMGPEKGIETKETETYPYVVVAVEDIGKMVIFK